MAKDCQFLNDFILDNLPKMPAGELSITETFEIDANGILKVSATEMSTGVKNDVQINAKTFWEDEDQLQALIIDGEEKRRIMEKQKQIELARKQFRDSCANIIHSLTNDPMY